MRESNRRAHRCAKTTIGNVGFAATAVTNFPFDTERGPCPIASAAALKAAASTQRNAATTHVRVSLVVEFCDGLRLNVGE
jgi:hypothetical protein